MRALFLIFSAISAVSPHVADSIEATIMDGGSHYVYIDDDGHVSMWQESNGRVGLQTRAFAGDSTIRAYPADNRILL